MTTFDDRENAFEAKFAHDAELQFRVDARRNKLVGLWAAELLGKSGDEAAAYAMSVVQADASATTAAMSAPPSQIPVLSCIPLSRFAPMGLAPMSALARVPRVDPWTVDEGQTGACRRLSA